MNNIRNNLLIETKIRKYKGPDKRGHYILIHDTEIIDPAETYYENINKPVSVFTEHYLQLSHETDKNIRYDIFLLEIIAKVSQKWISCGFNWLLIGTLNTEERYCVVLYVMVKDFFKEIGLSNLLKVEEINLAKKEKCDFIQTYHEKTNPFFNQAIIPSLKNGFVLYHGRKGDGELYEEEGFVHLRKYLKGKKFSSQVEFEDGKIFLSPDQNNEIIQYIKNSKKEIVKISECPPRSRPA